jgi:hypothetical protein
MCVTRCCCCHSALSIIALCPKTDIHVSRKSLLGCSYGCCVFSAAGSVLACQGEKRFRLGQARNAFVDGQAADVYSHVHFEERARAPGEGRAKVVQERARANAGRGSRERRSSCWPRPRGISRCAALCHTHARKHTHTHLIPIITVNHS